MRHSTTYSTFAASSDRYDGRFFGHNNGVIVAVSISEGLKWTGNRL